MLIPVLTIFWRGRVDKSQDKVQKSDLVTFKVRDLFMDRQLEDVHRQLSEYERSKEPEVGGRWNRVCSGCGYVNHERYRYCESCGCTLVEEAVEVIHVCPKCNTTIAHHSRECHECGARFWSPIILSQSKDGTGPKTGPEGLDEVPG